MDCSIDHKSLRWPCAHCFVCVVRVNPAHKTDSVFSPSNLGGAGWRALLGHPACPDLSASAILPCRGLVDCFIRQHSVPYILWCSKHDNGLVLTEFLAVTSGPTTEAMSRQNSRRACRGLSYTAAGRQRPCLRGSVLPHTGHEPTPNVREAEAGRQGEVWTV